MKILAVDLGTARIKSVLLDSRFNRFDIRGHNIIEVDNALEAGDVPATVLNESQLAALKHLWDLHHNSVDRIVTNVPYSLYTSRLLTFPFSDKKRVQANAQFQVEDEVPFDLEKCIISNHIYARKGQETQGLCGVAQTGELQNFITSMNAATGMDPDVITCGQSAFSAFLERSPELYGDGGIAIINLGHRKSTISIFRDGKPVLSRKTMVAGFHITEAIAQTYNVSMPDAETAKINSGFLAPPGVEQTEEQRMFSDLIAVVLEPVFHDFYQCLMAYFSRHHERVQRIFISGGTALLPGTSDYLSARWQLPVHPISLTSQLPNISLRPPAATEMQIADAIALGMTQVEGRSKNIINFRSGPLRSTKSVFDWNLQQLSHPIRMGAIVYVIAILSLSMQQFLLADQVRDREIKRDQAIRDVFGRPKGRLLLRLKNDPVRMRKEAQAKIAELKTQIGGTADTGYSALRTLKIMSETVPEPPVVEIRRMTLSPTAMALNLESPSAKEVQQAIERLKSMSIIESATDPRQETTEAGSTKAAVEFKLKGGQGT